MPSFTAETLNGWKTYNFEVAEHHTYVADGIRVHNTSVYVEDVYGNTLYVDIPDGEAPTTENTGLDLDEYQVTAIGNYDENGKFVVDDYLLRPTHYPPGHPNAGDPLPTVPDRLEPINGGEDGYDSEYDTHGGGWNGPGDSTGDGGRANDGGNGWSTHDDRPIVLDLDGDGVEIAVQTNAFFDWDDDGFLEQGSWVSADDGFLVLDLNADGTRGSGDGVIDQARELVWSLWGEDGDTDLQALGRAFDDNDDGVIDAQDSVWSELHIWQDLNQDGITDDGELKSLADWGITQINVSYDDGTAFEDTSDDITVFGNTLHGLASFVHDGTVIEVGEDDVPVDGVYTAEGGVGDVSLSYNSQGWRQVTTALGYAIEFETGESYQYAVLDGTGTADINLDQLVLDGATGDARDNHLFANGHSRAVQISGGDGNDTVWGGGNDDFLSGDAGADDVRGNDGNDFLFVDAADFNFGYVSGGNGFDIAIVTGDVGVSVLLTDHALEGISGGNGNDNLSAFGVWDDVSVSGGSGDDTITGSSGNDNLSGGDGDDLIGAGLGSDFVSGGAGIDTLWGGGGDDYVSGGAGNDALYGGTGDDRLFGGDGDDTLFGHRYDDILDGGDGDDVLNGGYGDDVLRGGDGNDSLYYWRGDDELSGGAGDDTFYLQYDTQYEGLGHWGWAVFQGGEGFDTLVLDSNAVDSIVYIGGNQWQLRDDDSSSGRVVIDLIDIERLVFANGTEMTLSTDATADTSDEYLRINPNWYLGDSTFYTIVGDTHSTLVSLNSVANGSVYLDGGNTGTYVHTDAVGVLYTIAGGAPPSNTWLEFHDPTLHGWTGNDVLVDNHDSNAVYGGQGDDQIAGKGGRDTLHGGGGSDQIWGGADNDSLLGGSGADFVSGGDGVDTLFGHEGADVIYGDAGNDLALGGSGADTILGGDGNDSAQGGDGNDDLYGGLGDDTLKGNSGSDLLSGNDGHDLLAGGTGTDELYGGTGNDTLLGQNGFDALYGGDGDDSLQGDLNDDVLFGGDGNDTLLGGADRDTLIGGDGADVINGGDGMLDYVSYDGSDAGVSINLTTGAASGGHAEGDVISFIENVVGSAHNDHLVGNFIDNVMIGGRGADTLSGWTGHDSLDGGWDNDSLNGGDGNDHVYGGGGQDTLQGGDGDDYLSGDWEAGDNALSGFYYEYRINPGSVISHFAHLHDAEVAATGVTNSLNVSALDAAHEGTGDQFGLIMHGVLEIDAAGTYVFDFVHDDWFRVLVDGVEVYKFQGHGTGSMSLDLSEGQHDITLEYFEHDGAENLAISVTGPDVGAEPQDLMTSGLLGSPTDNPIVAEVFDDEIYAGIGHDTLNGGIGNDLLNGQNGADVLTGGYGADTLTGGQGNDTFVFQDIEDSGYGSNARDTITDFTSGPDVIDLSAIDALTTEGGDQAFNFIGTALHTGDGATLRYVHAGGNTHLYGDVDGDGAGDFTILLIGEHLLTADDFVL